MIVNLHGILQGKIPTEGPVSYQPSGVHQAKLHALYNGEKYIDG